VKKIIGTLLILAPFAALPPVAHAQQPMAPGATSADTPPAWRPGMGRQRMMRPGMGGDTARARMLREQIEQRFGQMVQQELQLTEPQMQQLHAAMRAHQERRRELAQRQQAVNEAIRYQMRPGIAADRDSLSRLLDAQTHLRVEHAQQEEQLDREVNFLTPVQRARFMQMMRALEQRIQEIRMRQMQRMGPGGPQQGQWGPRPNQRPMRQPPE
jgi:hypothetical protein